VVIKLTEFLSFKTSNTDFYGLSKEEIASLLSECNCSGEIDKEISIIFKCALNFVDLPIRRIMVSFEDIESVDLFLEAEYLFISNQRTNISNNMYIKIF
jgi:CBS domain containing-hemolysin-like protein